MTVMRLMSKLAAGTAVVALAAFAGVGLAKADGMPGKRVVYEKPWDWGGFYFGVHAGYAWSDINADYALTTNANCSATSCDFSNSHDAPIYGGQIGIQHQFGQIVIGIEGSLSSSFQNRWGGEGDVCPGTLAKTVSCQARFDDVLTVGPRLGFAMGKWMPYLTGGYANARFSERAVTIASGTNFEEGSARHGGWYLGAGVDMALAQGWTIGLEYRHYEFDSQPVTFHTPAGVAVPIDTWNMNPSLDTVTMRVSWKFGRPDCCAPLK